MAIEGFEEGNTKLGSVKTGLRGNFVLKPTSKMSLQYSSLVKGRTLFRVWADVEDKKMRDWRNTEGKLDPSFFVKSTVCNRWGVDQTFTALMDTPHTSDWTESPLGIFHERVLANDVFVSKCKLERTDNAFKFTTMDPPEGIGFMKGILLSANGKNFFERPKWGTILVMKQTMCSSFYELLQKAANDESRSINKAVGVREGWADDYYIGDPIGAEHGLIFEFAHEESFKEASEINIGVQAAPAQGQMQTNRWGCRIFLNPKGQWFRLPLTDMNLVQQHDETFNQALNLMSPEEQITKCLIPGYGMSCKDVLIHVFKGTDLLPSSFINAKVHNIPAAVQPATEGQPAAQDPAINMGAPAAAPAVTAPAVADAGGINMGAPAESPAAVPALQTPVAEELKAQGTVGDVQDGLAAELDKA